MKRLMLASACVLALGGLSNANAQPWAASLNGDWEHTNFNLGHLGCPNQFCNVDGYDIDGAVDLPWTPMGVGIELNAASHGNGGAHDTQAGGSLIWNDIPNFRLAGTVVYNWASLIEAKVPEWQLGVGGEWYANPWLTVSAQGGGIAGKLSGGYFGGTIKGYVCPDASIAGYVNYVSISTGPINANETDFGVKGEWQFLRDTLPLSVTAGYEHAQINPNFLPFHVSPDSFHIGLKLYLDEGMTSESLVDRNRTGTLDTIGPITPIGFRAAF